MNKLDIYFISSDLLINFYQKVIIIHRISKIFFLRIPSSSTSTIETFYLFIGELSVIVEYCKFGNIHNYMLRHREVFIDQLTDNKEKNLGKVNRGFSCSTGSTG